MGEGEGEGEGEEERKGKECEGKRRGMEWKEKEGKKKRNEKKMGKAGENTKRGWCRMRPTSRRFRKCRNLCKRWGKYSLLVSDLQIKPKKKVIFLGFSRFSYEFYAMEYVFGYLFWNDEVDDFLFHTNCKFSFRRICH